MHTKFNQSLTSSSSKERGFHIIGGITISVIGLIVTVTSHTHNVKYAGLCILLFGSYVSAPLTAAWLSGNTPGKFHTPCHDAC
jgi:dolichol kinase